MFSIQRISADTFNRIENLLELVTQYVLVWYSVGESNPSFPPWKGGVLTDRRTEHITQTQIFKEHLIDFSIYGIEYNTSHISCQQLFCKVLYDDNTTLVLMEWVTGIEPA